MGYHVKAKLFSKRHSDSLNGICFVYKLLNDTGLCQDLLHFLGASEMVRDVWTNDRQ